MKKVLLSNQYKKDFKKYSKNPQKTQKIFDAVTILARGEQLPSFYKPHKLIGQYNHCLECHIESDLLWIDEEEQTIRLIRLGSHSELFK